MRELIKVLFGRVFLRPDECVVQFADLNSWRRRKRLILVVCRAISSGGSYSLIVIFVLELSRPRIPPTGESTRLPEGRINCVLGYHFVPVRKNIICGLLRERARGAGALSLLCLRWLSLDAVGV